MSKEQWGHGYYNGVKDGITGKADVDSLSKDNIKEAALATIHAISVYMDWREDWSPIRLRDIPSAIITGFFVPISKSQLEMVCEYIWKHEEELPAVIYGYPGKKLDYDNDCIGVLRGWRYDKG